MIAHSGRPLNGRLMPNRGLMATRRLYWENPYLRTFESRVVRSFEYDGRPAVVLDATAFYPTSGGQPHDTGTLNDVPVVEVLEDDGQGAGPEVVHVLAAPLADEGVRGVVHWERRLDHMQQHTGQHILSQAFERVLGGATVGFHLGAESGTIDVSLSSLDADSVARVEDLANEIVTANRAIEVQIYDSARAAGTALRRDAEIHGPVRIVTIEDFDVCACGGTHLRATGEVGIIHIRRWERSRGRTRVEFLCGRRALVDYRARDTLCQMLAGRMSVGVNDLPDAVGRLAEAEGAARRHVDELRTRLLDLELPRLAANAEEWNGLRLVCRLLEGYDAGNMRYLAQGLTRQVGTVALLAVTEPAPQVCFARADDVPVDMGALLKESMTPYGGRGGGRPHMAQGGGVDAADLTKVLDTARRRLAAEEGF